ncbi:uncharacterized protein [Oscarella lobularis]|uniref:uncharacterized protein isoform X2 n=1 Tax=Oscarella lobularis TaxID=121494 RepID=UPI003314409C
MADPKWKTHLQPNVATVTESIFVTGTFLDLLVSYGLINGNQRARIDLAGIESDKATKLFDVLTRCSRGSFDKFCQALDKTSQGHLAEILLAQDECDAAIRRNNPEGISTSRERQSSVPEHSHVRQTERRRNEGETNGSNKRLFYVFLLLAVVFASLGHWNILEGFVRFFMDRQL